VSRRRGLTLEARDFASLVFSSTGHTLGRAPRLLKQGEFPCSKWKSDAKSSEGGHSGPARVYLNAESQSSAASLTRLPSRPTTEFGISFPQTWASTFPGYLGGVLGLMASSVPKVLLRKGAKVPFCKSCSPVCGQCCFDDPIL
jgi:hypothetical protein